MTKRILHVIDSMDPAKGGPSEVVRALFEFAPEGYTGEVVTLDEPGSVFLADYPFVVHALGHGWGPIGYSSSLDRWLRGNRDRFDGALVHGLWRYVSAATWRALRGRKPYVVYAHGMLDPYFKRRFPLKHMGKWVYWVLAEYWVLRGAYRVLFTTEEESQLARQSFWLHRWNAIVAPYGATGPALAEETLRAAFHECVRSLGGKRFLLFLGRIHPKKGCDMLMTSFAKLAARDPELHLVMAGPNHENWNAELREIVARAGLNDRVHWPGMLRGEVKWGAFYACEAFVLPSHQENLGIAVTEAMACGRAVLLSDKVSIARQIAEDGAGLMESDTPAGTDRLLQRWMELPPAARKAMGEAALASFQSRYDMRKNAPEILRLFDGVSAGKR
jgi:glycosyltransferase involved in cell wall biosynthesis